MTKHIAETTPPEVAPFETAPARIVKRASSPPPPPAPRERQWGDPPAVEFAIEPVNVPGQGVIPNRSFWCTARREFESRARDEQNVAPQPAPTGGEYVGMSEAIRLASLGQEKTLTEVAAAALKLVAPGTVTLSDLLCEAQSHLTPRVGSGGSIHLSDKGRREETRGERELRMRRDAEIAARRGALR